MVKRTVAIMALGAIICAVWGWDGQVRESAAKDAQSRTVEDAYKQAMDKRSETEPIEERLAITKEFLDEFPESKHTANALSAVVYYQGEKLGDMKGAIAYAEAIRSKVGDAEIARAVDKEMIGLYGDADMMGKMLALADRLAADGALDFGAHWDVIETATRVEEWKLVRDYCNKAGRMANAETFRADWPDLEFTDEEVAEAVDNRVGMLLVKDGWARANLGEVNEALADFAKAGDLVNRSYIDVPEYDLDLYWGRTLMMKGDHQAAIERFAVEGLMARDEEAVAGLMEAYVNMHGSVTGFDAFAAKLHRSIAKTVDDFKLPDYKGKLRRLTDLRGDVTLVAFWFPT